MTSTIQSIPVDPTPPLSGEGLIYNGSAYVPTPANPGDITAVNTTLPLTGGGASGALTLDINNFTGDSGAGGLDGAVPAPALGDAAAGKVLGAGGGWVVPAAGGMALLAYAENSAYLDAGGTPGAEGDVLTTLQFSPTKTSIKVLFDPGGAYWVPGGGFSEATLYVDLGGVISATRRFRATNAVIGLVNMSVFNVAVIPGNNYILKIRSSVTGSNMQFAVDTNMTYSVTVMEG